MVSLIATVNGHFLAHAVQNFRGNPTVLDASHQGIFDARVSAGAPLNCCECNHSCAASILISLLYCFGNVFNFISSHSYREQTSNQLQFIMTVVGGTNLVKCIVSHVHSRANSNSSSIGSLLRVVVVTWFWEANCDSVLAPPMAVVEVSPQVTVCRARLQYAKKCRY